MEDDIWIRRESFESHGPLLRPSAPEVTVQGSNFRDRAPDTMSNDPTSPPPDPPEKKSILLNLSRKVSVTLLGRTNKVSQACEETKNGSPVINVILTGCDGNEENPIIQEHRYVQHTVVTGHKSPRRYNRNHKREGRSSSNPPLVLGLSACQSWKEPTEMGVPSLIQKQHANEHRIKAFVSFMFLCIVLLVGFAHVFFNQKIAQQSYFESVRFHRENRSVHISNSSGAQLLKAWLGVPLPDNSVGYKCREKDLAVNDSAAFCFEWINQARLQVSLRENDNLRCYAIQWQSLSDSFSPMDCFDMSELFWFGGGLTSKTQWPLNTLNVPLSPFVTGAGGENKWGEVLKRQFISSSGAALVIDEYVPLWVGVQDSKLCLAAKSGYPFSEGLRPLLNYTICTGADAPSAVKNLADHGLWDGIRKDEMEVIRELLYDPIWRYEINRSDSSIVENLVNFTNRIMSVEWTSPGYLLLSGPWEDVIGDLKFDSNRFQDFEDAFEIIHRKGFKIAVQSSPYFSTFSANYREGLNNVTNKGHWINHPSRDGEPLSPALMTKDGDTSMALLDPTYPPAAKWYSMRLSELKETVDVDAVLLDIGATSNLPRFFQTAEPLVDPSKLSSYFLKSLRSASITILGTTSAVEMPRLPTFISLPAFPPTWEGLQSLIPTILTLSVIGYPFMITPPIGGNRNLDDPLPSKGLYIRWLQLNTFLPVVQFELLPFDYDSETMEIAEKLARLRRNLVMPLIKKIADESVLTGGPIIRPIWFLDPNDKNAFDIDINDQFCIGDTILVAPVLKSDHVEREIYLPKGVWKDGIDGSLRKGGRWLHHHKADLDEIPYFIQMPDGTRL